MLARQVPERTSLRTLAEPIGALAPQRDRYRRSRRSVVALQCASNRAPACAGSSTAAAVAELPLLPLPAMALSTQARVYRQHAVTCSRGTEEAGAGAAWLHVLRVRDEE